MRRRFADLRPAGSRTAAAAWLLVLSGCGDYESQSDRAFDLVRGQALAIEQNSDGYTEADLGGGHVLVYVPAGTFDMGSADGVSFEQPVHQVFLNGYWIDKFPVTVTQFRTFVADTDYQTDAERGEGCWVEEPGDIRYDASWRNPYVEQLEDEPVLCVSWNDAMAYAAWMSDRTGLSFNLPTEAQWERAARGDDARVYPWGDTPPDGSQANFGDINYLRAFPERRNPSPEIDDGYRQTSPVRAFPAGRSPFGVFDLAGNTIDWLYDWFDPGYYSVSPETDPTGPSRQLIRHKVSFPGGWSSNLQRSIRGGAWTDTSGQLSLDEGGHSIRSDRRESTDQFSSDDHLSFRLAVDTNRPPLDLEVEQANFQQPDERALVAEQIGDALVTIQYRRSSVAGRERRLFGVDVPYGQAWSPGAPNPAILSSSEDVLFEGEPLAAGMYAMTIVPEELEASGEWTVVLHEWEGRAGPGEEVLQVRSRAQIEDNSKEHLEVFFDTQPEGGVIARVLWEYVEVHLGLSDTGRTPVEEHIASAPRAEVMNSFGRRELALSYRREYSRTLPLFGGEVAFDREWKLGDAVLEARGDLLLGNQLVRAGRYEVSFMPHSGATWSLRLTPLEGQVLEESPISIDASVETGDESLERLEIYFDHSDEGDEVLVLVWGKKMVRVAVAEPPGIDRQG